MRVWIALEQPEKLAGYLDCELSPKQEADAHIVFTPGDVSDPARTVAVITLPDEAQQFIKKGVAPENILVTGTAEAHVKQIAPHLKKMLEEIRPVKVIAFVSPKGGTGRTTLAASLAEHYAALGLKAVLLDTADPPNAHYHYQSVRGDLSMVEADKIVVDTPPSFREFDRVDAVVLVVSPDLVQCIEPAKAIPKARAVVYNRRRPELPEEVVKSAFPNIPVITVDDDYQGCAAALAVGVPASNRSLKIAEAVGTLAAVLDGKGVVE